MLLMTRRNAIRCAAGAAAFAATAVRRNPCFALPGSGDYEVTKVERDEMAGVATTFMQTFEAPALSIAIARHGRTVYREAFGVSNRETGERTSISNLFRIASVTKPLTAAAVFILVEQGKIRLEDRVFGKEGILGEKYGTPPYNKYVEDITVDHLLTHTCGGWDNGALDPMFLKPSMDQADLIALIIDKRSLQHPPGTRWAYSNFGYCLLGRVIEAGSRQSYADFMERAILAPCGVVDMRIAGNTLKQRDAGEVTYYGQNGEDPYDMNIKRMDSHGGWLATPEDLVRFASHVDGFNATANILKLDTIKKMTTPCSVNEHYARGWSVNKLGNWWHNGSLPGTTAIMVRTSSGFCWAALTNTRRQPSDAINLALDDMVWEMARKVRSWGL